MIAAIPKTEESLQTSSSKLLKMISQTIVKDLPDGCGLLENQVAGHTFQNGTNELGMLKCQEDGSVLKAASKPICGAREIDFYESLNSNVSDPMIATLRKLVPEYRGTVNMSFRGKTIDFMKLADITHDMSQPCVMDIKIGKRTWDPCATPEKIQAEEQKYQSCKETYGFCIPGFQVYDIKSGRIKRFGKDYGKNMCPNAVKDALKIFLNADTKLSRLLLVKFLSTLRTIQTWARTQTTIRIFSSSLLLAYDAKEFKNHLDGNQNNSNSSTVSSRSSSVDSTSNKHTPTASMGEPMANANGDTRYDGCNGSNHLFNNTDSIELCKKLNRSHSTQNNYENHIRKDYDFYLDKLIDEYNAKENREWALVKMIDFAHVFPAEGASIDTNYLFGIENLVKIFEEFLLECD